MTKSKKHIKKIGSGYNKFNFFYPKLKVLILIELKF